VIGDWNFRAVDDFTTLKLSFADLKEVELAIVKWKYRFCESGSDTRSFWQSHLMLQKKCFKNDFSVKIISSTTTIMCQSIGQYKIC